MFLSFIIPDTELEILHRIAITFVFLLVSATIGITRGILNYRKAVAILFDNYESLTTAHTALNDEYNNLNDKHTLLNGKFDAIMEKHKAVSTLFQKKSKQLDIAEEHITLSTVFYLHLSSLSGSEANPEEKERYRTLQNLHIDAKNKIKGVEIDE